LREAVLDLDACADMSEFARLLGPRR
jgi:hypothetical protein